MRNFQSRYLKNTRDIRRLSVPQIVGDFDRKQFYLAYKENFRLIRIKANNNHNDIEEFIVPYLSGKKDLNAESSSFLKEFAAKLVSANKLQSVDRILALKIHERLFKYYQDNNMIEEMLGEAIDLVDLYFYMQLITNRTNEVNVLAAKNRIEGRKYCEICEEYLEFSKFTKLSPALRLSVLNTRVFSMTFYENEKYDNNDMNKKLEIARKVHKLNYDLRYRALMPKFDWNSIDYKIANYLVRSVEYDLDIYTPDKVLKALISSAKFQYETIAKGKNANCDLWLAESYYAKLQYLSGKLSAADYEKILFNIYYKRNKKDYDISGLTINMYLPSLILDLYRQVTNLSRIQKQRLKEIYNNVIYYNIEMPKNDSLEIYINYLGLFIMNFIELPDVLLFSEFIQTIMATCHASSYIHSVVVATISKKLATHLIETNPEYFVDGKVIKTLEEVHENKQKVINFVYNCGLYHDVGKIFYIDTISEYHRSLFDEEQEIIRQHPQKGYELLSRFKSTEQFADIARLHHIWYDNSNGYPYNVNKSESPFSRIVDIISLADCLDASTDTVCRSYNKGITLEEYIEELRANSGKRYAPILVEQFDNSKFVREVRRIVEAGREDAYYKMFVLYERVLGNL